MTVTVFTVSVSGGSSLGKTTGHGTQVRLLRRGPGNGLSLRACRVSLLCCPVHVPASERQQGRHMDRERLLQLTDPDDINADIVRFSEGHDPNYRKAVRAEVLEYRLEQVRRLAEQVPA